MMIVRNILALLHKCFRFLRPEGHENLEEPLVHDGVQVRFILAYEKLTIGHLLFDGVVWTFQYTQEFIQQDRIRPLTDFPRTEKTYIMDVLHPFFTQRIPSMKQPQVQERVRKANADKNDLVKMLELFGKHAVANPFTLVPG